MATIHFRFSFWQGMQSPAFDLRSAFRWHRILNFSTGCLAESSRDCRLCTRELTWGVKNQMHSLTTHHMYHRLLQTHHSRMCMVLSHSNSPSYLLFFHFSFLQSIIDDFVSRCHTSEVRSGSLLNLVQCTSWHHYDEVFSRSVTV